MGDRSNARIQELPVHDRPRERLERLGPQGLTTPELLAILFRTGTREQNAVQLAEALCKRRGDLAGLAMASLDELAEVPGIGRVKAIEVKAAMELGKRLAAMSDEARPEIREPADVATLVMADLRYEVKEHFWLLILDHRCRLRQKVVISTGTLTESLVHPREVFREAIRFAASSVVLVHNHPSGDPDPSVQDVATTRRLSQAGKLLGIDVMDHIIIGDGTWASLKQLELME
jgi:DNA repair protein RadC